MLYVCYNMEKKIEENYDMYFCEARWSSDVDDLLI